MALRTDNKIAVDGWEYRWLSSRREDYGFVYLERAEQPGTTLSIDVGPSFEEPQPDWLSRVVREALAQGWKPGEAGEMYYLKFTGTEGGFQDVCSLFQPFDWVRELVENAIDAQLENGSTTPVRVSSDFRNYREGRSGTAVFTVSDQGVGMSREDVDRFLTRMHASSKIGTAQIGSKGLGFLAIFSAQPDAVFVDTGDGRSGLRLHIKPDGGFDRIHLEPPPRGTKVALMTEVRSDRYQAMQAKVEAELVRWFYRSQTPVLWNDLPLSPETTPAVAYSRTDFGSLGRVEITPVYPEKGRMDYFNRGVLISSEPSPWLGFRILVDSHRFSRSLYAAVERDAGFRTAMADLERLMNGPYFQLLLDEEEDRKCGCLASLVSQLEPWHWHQAVIPTTSGPRLALDDLARQSTVFWSPKPTAHRAILWDGESPGLPALVKAVNTGARLLPLEDRLELVAGPWFP